MRDKRFGKGESYYAAVNMIKDTWARKSLHGYFLLPGRFQKVPEKADFPYYSGLYKETLKLLNETTVNPKRPLFRPSDATRSGTTVAASAGKAGSWPVPDHVA